MLGRVWIVVALLTGCTTTFSGAAKQPNPLAQQLETLRTSEKITIVTSQMGLTVPKGVEAGDNTAALDSGVAHSRRYPFVNQASFTVVSRDRLRFHVQVDHSWEDWADLNTWQVDLVDDQGNHYAPEAVEHVRRHIITKMWDAEQRTSICSTSGAAGRNANGDCYNTIGYKNDGYNYRMPLGNISIFRGNGDYVFYKRDIFTPHSRWMRLTMHRPGQSFEFLWEFEDTVASN